MKKLTVCICISIMFLSGCTKSNNEEVSKPVDTDTIIKTQEAWNMVYRISRIYSL